MTWHHVSGSLADPSNAFHVAVTGDLPGWSHTSLRIANLGPGDVVEFACDGEEVIVVPLNGSYAAELTRIGAPDADMARFELAGRASVFAGPTDVLYVPAGHQLRIAQVGESGGAVALCGAYVTELDGRGIASVASLHPTLVPASEVPVELRGAGRAAREVRNFGVPGVLEASRIIACEVITPSGNWSSWPPHKHDEELPGQETQLEEIYYLQLQPDAAVPGGGDPVGYLRMRDHSSAPVDRGGLGADATPTLPGLDRVHLDELVEVRTGDVVLVPHGWHGPAMAPPGYDLYYLNVMAGPGPERAWLITDDPAHAWVRGAWADAEPDPRLPMGSRHDVVPPADSELSSGHSSGLGDEKKDRDG